jgi:Fe2+ or Zn2+ uptake regulation protein
VRPPEELTALFRRHGRKITPQREAVFRVLHHTSEHPTAESVHAAVSAQLPTVSLRTVYQVLNDLSAMGEIGALDLGTGSTRFDPTTGEHHHLVCRRCGAVRDLFLEDVVVSVPPEQAAGYSIGRPEITFRGLCPDCVDTTERHASNHGRRGTDG